MTNDSTVDPDLIEAAWENFADDAVGWIDRAGAELADLAALHGVAVTRHYIEERLTLLVGGLEERCDIRPASEPRPVSAFSELVASALAASQLEDMGTGHAYSDTCDCRVCCAVRDLDAARAVIDDAVDSDATRAPASTGPAVSPVAAKRVDGCDCDYCGCDGPVPARWLTPVDGASL